MTNPLVSIIVVSYNHSKYINENLDSIKNQTYSNIELIVADDASPDNSVQVFDSWLEDNNYQAVKNYHTKNTGLATVLNECIALAKGKYIKLIAADDYLHPRSILECVERLEELGEDFGLVFTDFEAVNDSNLAMPFHINYSDIEFDENGVLSDKQLLDYNCIIAPTTLIRRDLIIKTGEYKANFLLEDYDRWLRINAISKIVFINKKLSFYRVLETSISNTEKPQMIIEDLYLRIKYDTNGFIKNKIDSQIRNLYLYDYVPQILIKAYNNYPFKKKWLSFFLTNKLPKKMYIFLYNLR